MESSSPLRTSRSRCCTTKAQFTRSRTSPRASEWCTVEWAQIIDCWFDRLAKWPKIIISRTAKASQRLSWCSESLASCKNTLNREEFVRSESLCWFAEWNPLTIIAATSFRCCSNAIHRELISPGRQRRWARTRSTERLSWRSATARISSWTMPFTPRFSHWRKASKDRWTRTTSKSESVTKMASAAWIHPPLKITWRIFHKSLNFLFIWTGDLCYPVKLCVWNNNKTNCHYTLCAKLYFALDYSL